MKYVTLFFLIIVIIACISDTDAVNDQPQKVYRLVYEEKPQEWYERQSDLWKQEVVKDKQNTNAWYNYFMATRYAHIRENADTYKKITGDILSDMGESIPESYEYNYLQFYNGNRQVEFLDKAYAVDPSRPDVLYEYILYHEKSGNGDQLKRFCRELYNSKDISPGLLNYNYNMLASTDQNAILFTNGDNDSYPAWTLQQNFDVRKDVLILNLHMTFTDRTYLKRKLQEKGIDLEVSSLSDTRMNQFISELCQLLTGKYPEYPVYMAATVYSQTIKDIRENLYLVGLALKYSVKRFDNIERIRYNVHHSLRLDYLDFDWYAEQYPVDKILDRLHVNYVVFFLKLAEDYHQSGNDSEAKRWKNKAMRLAEKAENENFTEHIRNLAW